MASYIVVTPTTPSAVAFAAAVSAVRIPELDARLADGAIVQVHVINHGPAGLVEHIHRTVYAELGLPPAIRTPTAATARPPALDDLRGALRALHSDAALAASALAALLLPATTGRHDRAVQVRSLLLNAVEAAWPDTLGAERRALDVAYLHPTSRQPTELLHMSRSSWFRLLRRAVDGVLTEVEALSLR